MTTTTPTAAAANFVGLKGKTALITGGTSGIGRATALAAARAGANVVITGRRDKEGKEVESQLRAMGVQALFVQGDVTDEAHVKAAVDAAVKLGKGRLDFAFNNAGIELGGVPTVEATPAQYRQVFDINVLGVLLSMKHEIRAMSANSGAIKGSIVNTSSIAGQIGMPGAGIYIGTKHAVNGLTKSAALETAKLGIRINTVSPAAIDTDMMSRFTGNRNPDAMNWLTSLHPVGRMGTPEEIAQPVLFLFSEAASFITGQDLLIDGAFTTQ
jgi:NAD(P)-dependent dehydrogenase (short-subunit alcohol dehydrogenase family)